MLTPYRIKNVSASDERLLIANVLELIRDTIRLLWLAALLLLLAAL